MQCDQENALATVLTEATHSWHAEVVPEYSPKGESQSNGEVERAIQQVHGMVRTVKESLEMGINMSIPPKHPVLS